MDEQRTDDVQVAEDTVEIYSTVICTLKPEVVTMLRECSGGIRAIIEERTHIKFDGETNIRGKWAEVEGARRLLDEMVSLSSGNATEPAKASEGRPQEVDPRHGDRNRGDADAVLRIGSCRHRPCSWRSPVHPFDKAVVLFMRRYLPDEVESVMRNHALFVLSDIDDDSVLVQCCGDDEQDAKRQLSRFAAFYRSAAAGLWVGEFPYCSMLDDRFCQFLLDRLPCLVQNRPGEDVIMVTCDKRQKDDVTDLLHKICAAKHDDSIAEASDIGDISERADILVDIRAPSQESNAPSQESNAPSEFYMKISISCADVTTLAADAIICVNDDALSCSSEVSSRVAGLLGADYRRECERRAGDLRPEPFGVVTVPTEKLGFIINVIAPPLKTIDTERDATSEDTCKKVLKAIYSSGIEAAKQLGVSYLALPPLYLDQADVPNLWMAEAMCQVLMEAMKSKGSLKRICIAHQNTAVLRLIWDEMKKHLEPFTVDGVTLTPETRTTSAGAECFGARHEEQSLTSKRGIPYGFRTSDNVAVLIHKFDITQLHVDAIVNAANEVLGHAFAISKRIADAGGPELDDGSGPIPLSRAVVTSARELPCDYVIHAVVVYWPVAHDDEKKKHCLELLRDTITNIIETAEQHRMKSVAVPAVITGTFGVAKLDAAKIVFEALTTAKTRSLKEIHLVHTKEQLLSVVGDVFRQKCADEQNNCTALDENKLIRIIRKRSREPASQHFKPNARWVVIAHKNVPFTDAEAIICPNDEKLSCGVGSAMKMAQTDGGGYKRRCYEAARQKSLHASDVVVVESEMFGSVINVIVPQLTTPAGQLDEDEQLSYKMSLSKTLSNAIDEAIRLECVTLAIIPLGAEQENVPELWAAEVVSRVVVDAIHSSAQIKAFYIVHDNLDVVESIRNQFRNRFKSLTGAEGTANRAKITEASGEASTTFEIADLGTTPPVPSGFVTTDGIELFFHEGPIEELSVDVRVQPTIENTGGGLGRLPVGEPAVISDKSPRGESIIHVIMPGSESADLDMTLVAGMVTNIVRTADRNGFTSLAMPMISSGIDGKSNSRTEEAICAVLSEIKTKTLKEIHVIGTADECFQLMRGALPCLNSLPESYTSDVLLKRRMRKPRKLLSEDGVQIFGCYADIENLNVDAIVCSNNGSLTCPSALAKSIAYSAGIQYVNRCANTAKGTSLRPSDVVCVETERFGVIMHAVVPDMSALSRDDSDDTAIRNFLYKTYTNIFNEVRNNKFSSVAVPLLGSDQEATPKCTIAEVMCQVLTDKLKTCPQLKEVYIIDVDDELLTFMHNTFMKCNKSGPVIKRTRQGMQQDLKSQHLRTESSVPRTIPEKEYKIPCGFLINNKIRLCIHKSDITRLHVDAIVNTTDDRLRHGTDVAKAISAAAGPELKKEGGEIIKRSGPIDVSKTVITSAGRLPCEAVIHAVGPRWPSDHDKKKEKHCLKLLQDTIANVMQIADENDFETLAIPPITSGTPGVPKEDVARVMCDAITGANTTNLKEIHVVDNTDETLLLITRAFDRAVREKTNSGSLQLDELAEDIVSSAVQRSRTLPLKPFLVREGVKIFMSDSPIENINTDGCVCPNDVNLSSSNGVAKAVSDLVGDQYAEMCKHALDKEGKLQPGDVVPVNTERLGLIINAIIPPPSSAPHTNEDGRLYKQALCKALDSAFKAANKHDVSRLALLPIETSQFTTEIIVDAMCEALVNGLEICKQLKEVHIVERDRNFASLMENRLAEQMEAAAANTVAPQTSYANIILSNQPVSVTQSQVKLSEKPKTSPQMRTTVKKPLASTGQKSPSGRKLLFPCGFATGNRVRVFLHKSALSELNVDAVVCFANGKLACATEVKNPIYDIAGSGLQREIQRALASRGTIPTTETVVTSAGMLPCKKVIHAVGRKWTAGDDKAKRNECLKLIPETFINIIHTADKEGFQSVAMPASVLGMFGVQKSAVAASLCEVLTTESPVCLNEIHLVDISGQSLTILGDAFVQADNALRPNGPPGIKQLDQSVVSSTIEKRLQKTPLTQPSRKPKNNIPCGYETKDKKKVFIHKNALTKLGVDAIVCPVDEHSAAGVVESIHRDAGPALEMEKKKLIVKNGPIAKCGTMVTPAGELPCQNVIHAFGPKWTSDSTNKKQCLKEARETLTNIIQTADEHGYESLAIPAGIFGELEPELAPLFCELLTNTDTTSLKEVHLVDMTDQSLFLVQDAFVQLTEESSGKPSRDCVELDQDTVSSVTEKRLQQTPRTRPSRKPKAKIPCGYETKDKKKVFIHKNALTKLGVDAIVCPVDEHSAAGVVESIHRDAGPALEMEKKKLIVKNGPIAKCGTMVTPAGELPCQNVIHAFGPKWTSDSTNKKQCLKEARETLTNIIQTADEHGYESLAMPAAAAGLFGELKPEMAPTLCEVLAKTDTVSLKEVHLVDVTDQSLYLTRDAFVRLNKESSEDRVLGGVELDQETVRTAIERRLGGEPKAVLIGDGVKVFVSRSDITRVKTEAVVCPNDEQLSSISHVAKKVADLAGKPYKEKCQRAAATRSLQPSDVVSIDTNNLGVIINAVVPELSSSFFQSSSFYDYLYKELLRMTFTNAIDEARKRAISSFAMSPLGADQEIVPNLWVVDKLCQSLLDGLKEEEHQIREVHVADERNGIVKFVWSELSERVSASCPPDGLRREPATRVVIHDRVQVYVYRAELTKLKAEAVICSNDSKLSCSRGAARALADVAGDVYRQSCKTAARTSRLQPADVVCIEAGHLGVVINAVVPRVTALFGTVLKYEDAVFRELLLATYKNAIEEAKQLGIHCLILTPLGADDEDIPRSWIAEAMSQALIDCLKVDQQLNEIHIVDLDIKVLRRLWDELFYMSRRKY